MAPNLAVIVPARAEATNIGRRLRGLVHRNTPSGLVIDDQSADSTAGLLAARSGAHGNEPQPGNSGMSGTGA
jgi:hypothetical protein